MRSSFSGKKVIFLLLAGTLSACDSWQEGWTAEYQTQFRNACLSGDGQHHPDPGKYCDCVLEKTKKRYPTIAAFMELKDSTVYRHELQQCP